MIQTFPKEEQCPNCDKTFENCKCTTKDRFNISKEEPKTAWVGVLHDRLNEYHPAEYELKDIYQGDGCLPNFPNEELCQIWCDSKYKEEPKQKTLEKAIAKKLYPFNDGFQVMDVDISEELQVAFINGAKWQQEQDSSFTAKYIKSEMEFQIQRMTKLGINTTGQCFEQMVTSLILLAERDYNEEEVLNILYKHTEDLLAGKKLTLEKWFEQLKKNVIQ